MRASVPLLLFLNAAPCRADLLELADCCTGTHLKIGLPPTTFEPLFTYDSEVDPAERGSGPWGGFLAEQLDQLASTMGFTYSTIPAAPWMLDRSAGEQMLSAGTVDLLLSDASPVSVQQDTFVYHTVPFHNSFHTAIVRKAKKQTSLFRFLDPFTMDLYLTIFSMIIGTALLLSLLDMLWPAGGVKPGENHMCDGKGDLRGWSQSFISSVYHISVATVGGEDYEWLTAPLKLLRAGLLLVVLVVNATYTANLAAFLSAPSVQIFGPSTMDELGSSSRVCALHPAAWASAAAEAYGSSMLTASLDDIPDLAPGIPNIEARKVWVREQLDADTCDVWLQDAVVLQKELLANCESREALPFVSVVPIMYNMVGIERQLVANISAGLAALGGTPRFDRLKRDNFGTGLTCGADESSSTQISAQMMAGVYIIFATFSGLAVLLAAVLRLQSELSRKGDREASADKDMTHTATEGDMLRAILRKVERMDQRLEGEHPGSKPANEGPLVIDGRVAPG
jgi:hypothetical protein